MKGTLVFLGTTHRLIAEILSRDSHQHFIDGCLEENGSGLLQDLDEAMNPVFISTVVLVIRTGQGIVK